jgi:chemotaxis protein methyltransferase CheR
MRRTPLRTAAGQDGPAEIRGAAFERIRRILKTFGGFQLHVYKDACVKRRLDARMRAVGCATAEEYADLLLLDKSETDALIKALTINFSRFFRNPATFDRLRDEVLPSLFSGCALAGRDSLSIRSVGCAGGEEPYTLAMILRDSFAGELSRLKVSIVATDVDPEVLRTAVRASYGPESLEDTPPAMRERFFSFREGRFLLDPGIRDMVSFYREDLMLPRAGGEFDLILCRNVLIYFERRHQEAVLAGLEGTLRQGGVLVLGKTETLLPAARRMFRVVCPIERIYRKI